MVWIFSCLFQNLSFRIRLFNFQCTCGCGKTKEPMEQIKYLRISFKSEGCDSFLDLIFIKLNYQRLFKKITRNKSQILLKQNHWFSRLSSSGVGLLMILDESLGL